VKNIYNIIYSTKEQKEKHKDEIYGYANDLSEIKKIIYKYADEYICEYKNKIFYEMEQNNRISQNTFYEMFNLLPSVKYFDISQKIWYEYEIDEVELHEYFLSNFKYSLV
jgi:6-pyruvoyl-tetrahydropterin synthase